MSAPKVISGTCARLGADVKENIPRDVLPIRNNAIIRRIGWTHFNVLTLERVAADMIQVYALSRPPLSCRTSPPQGGRLRGCIAAANLPPCGAGQSHMTASAVEIGAESIHAVILGLVPRICQS